MKQDPYKRREARKYANPIASREFILETMEEIAAPVSFKRLAKELDIGSASGREALRSRLTAMVRDGQVVVDRRGVYAIARRLELVTGKISAHPDGFGFLLVGEGQEDVFLSVRQMKAVFHGDVARVRIRGRDGRGRNEGEIVEVVERNTEQLVGRLYFEGKVAFIEPLNNRICNEVLVTGARVAEGKDGQIVVVQIIEQPSLHALPMGEIAEVLGDQLTPDMEVEIALRNNDIPTTWTDEVIELVDRMPIEVKADDKSSRKDLRELPFVTIDGEDARDFDDAVYCEAKQSGGWRLYVAIADVSHYVDVGTPLDQAAFERGTSVYFPQYVVPMLPEKLSNGLCSLNPKVDRLALVCEMTISERGRVSSYKFYEGVINSHARLTYTRVARIIDGEDDPEAAHVRADVLELHNLYKVLIARREDRSALDFDSTELQFSFAEDGSVAAIRPRSRNAAHRVIEECMLCANVSAARFIARHKKPGLYRVHDRPDMEKVEYLREFLARFGLELGGGEMPAPADFQAVIEQLRDRKNGHVLQMAVLRAMQQAVYQAENNGHFGLNYPEYTHFTSPIRRYPDLLVHRLVKSVIHSRDTSRLVERFGKPRQKPFYPYEMEEVIMMGEHCSFAERRADTAVYDVLEWIKCDYIAGHVGDVVEGVITAVTRFGFFVELVDLFVEGLIHVSTLASDYYAYDQESQCLVGERTHYVYGLGDAVTVQVARVNVEERKIDFELVTHSPLARRRVGSRRKAKSSNRRDAKNRASRPGGKKGRSR